jgi:hypothetical protein
VRGFKINCCARHGIRSWESKLSRLREKRDTNNIDLELICFTGDEEGSLIDSQPPIPTN